jgi:hypothetical protein
LIGLPETLTRPVRVSSDTGPQVSSDTAPRFQDRDAVHLGQPDIEHDGVIRFAVAKIVPLLAIERAIDHITGIRQCRRKLTVEIRIVLNNKQAQAGLQK